MMLIEPKKRTARPGNYLFGATVSAEVGAPLNNATMKTLWQGFCCQGGSIEMHPTAAPMLKIGTAELPPLAPDAEYALSVTPEGIVLNAANAQGLCHGYMTLLTMIEPQELEEGQERFAVPCGLIEDAPAVANRMLHLCVFPETTLPFLQKLIRAAGVLKYTHIILEFWGMLQMECLPELGWPQAYSKVQIRTLLQEAKEMGVSTVPMFNHLGHAPMSRGRHGKHTVLDQNPRRQTLFDADGWTWNIENPKTRRLMHDIRHELCELFGEGEYFHIGCDEAPRYQENEARAHELVAYWQEITDDLATLGRRPILWADMLMYRPDFQACDWYTETNSKDKAVSEILLGGIDKRIVIADWQYAVKRAPIETTDFLLARGFDLVGCPWNSRENIRAHAEQAKRCHTLGTIETTWHTLSAITPLILANAQLNWEQEFDPRREYGDSVAMAALLRRVWFVHGNYAEAGWCATQIGDNTD